MPCLRRRGGRATVRLNRLRTCACPYSACERQNGERVTPDLPGSLSVDAEDGGSVLRMRGEVDAEVVDQFVAQLGRDLPVAHAIDAGDVSFLDSSSVALMLKFVRRAAQSDETVILRRASSRVERLLEVTGAEALFLRSS